jgi:hypothetical protein
MKKSPKGWSTTLERVAATKAQKPKILPAPEKAEKAKKTDDTEKKSKKKSLDELLDSGLS